MAEYLGMLELELKGVPFNKSAHNRRLRELLDERTEHSVEFKLANISAVMVELGCPYIDGYKPRGNYQESLREAVSNQVDARLEIQRLALSIADAEYSIVESYSPADAFVEMPVRERQRLVREYFRREVPVIRQFDFLDREARNRSLGLAGELFVAEVEQRRLWTAGAKHLVDRVEHVSRTRGDGLGYDIRSFEVDGRERFVEVKTTNFGAFTPFFASANEVAVSSELPGYQLYRVFNFRRAPRIFTMLGALASSAHLEPTEYRVTLR